jgi:hypothetical protein
MSYLNVAVVVGSVARALHSKCNKQSFQKELKHIKTEIGKQHQQLIALQWQAGTEQSDTITQQIPAPGLGMHGEFRDCATDYNSGGCSDSDSSGKEGLQHESSQCEESSHKKGGGNIHVGRAKCKSNPLSDIQEGTTADAVGSTDTQRVLGTDGERTTGRCKSDPLQIASERATSQQISWLRQEQKRQAGMLVSLQHLQQQLQEEQVITF